MAAYLTEFDLSDFDSKAEPPKTLAWQEIVNVGCQPEDAELADTIDTLGGPDPNDPKTKLPPDAVTVPDLIAGAKGGFAEWLMNRGNRKSLPHRLARCCYTVVPNPDAKDKLWRCRGERQAIYVRTDLPAPKRLLAAQEKAKS